MARLSVLAKDQLTPEFAALAEQAEACAGTSGSSWGADGRAVAGPPTALHLTASSLVSLVGDVGVSTSRVI